MNYNNTRIAKLRTYLLGIIDVLKNSHEDQINANMLSNDINNYSLDKIPTQSVIETWIDGTEIHKDVYSFRSRLAYSQDVINNLSNIGFFEEIETKIKSNNDKGILPDIDGIEKIRCLNCGTMNFADTNTAVFDIQIQIEYKVLEDSNAFFNSI